jgi:hypothetical protein
MPYTVRLRRSGTAAATPTALEHGELALNYADGRIFWKNASNAITSFTFQAYALSSHTHAASAITSGTFATARIANSAITYAKIQNVSATDRILGRSSAGAGVVEEITCTATGRSIIAAADQAAARTAISAAGTASPTFTGTVTAAAADFSGAVTVTSPLRLTGTVAGNNRMLEWQTSGSTRWQVSAHFGAESGSNAGSDLYVTRWSDAGTFLGTPLQIRRDNGLVTCESGLVVQGNPLLVTGGSAAAPGIAFSGDTNTGLAQLSSAGVDTLSLVTNGSERVRVDADGNAQVGIANIAGLRFLDVVNVDASQDSGSIIRLITRNAAGTGNASADFVRYNNGLLNIVNGDSGPIAIVAGGAERARVTADGEVLIGTTGDNGAYLLQVNSQIYATNATIATSDARFKTNVVPLADATGVVEALRPAAFDFLPQPDRNLANQRQVGLIAQEVQLALAGTDYAGSVVARCGDHLGIAYEKLVPVLIRALQESNARIAALEERLAHA